MEGKDDGITACLPKIYIIMFISRDNPREGRALYTHTVLKACSGKGEGGREGRLVRRDMQTV